MPIKRDEFGRPDALPTGMRHWPAGDDGQGDPKSIAAMYERGFAGAYRDPEAAEALIASFGARRTFGDWASSDTELAGIGEGKLVMLYRYRMALDPLAYSTAQRRGDCVSFAFANACDAVRATEILAEGEPEAWIAQAATEWLYWGRGHSSEGASCATIGNFVTSKAGLLLRRRYDSLGLDFTTYNPRTGQDGRSGPPAAAIEVAREHPLAMLTLIESIEQARDAIAAGHALACCSGLSWSDVRDERGVSRRTPGGWAHAMCWDAVDARAEIVKRYGGPLFKVAQSWGDWNSGGWAPEYGPCPTGGFWILPKDAAAAIGHSGTFAVADAKGFRPTKLPTLGAGGRL
jgi:hypothetical protein